MALAEKLTHENAEASISQGVIVSSSHMKMETAVEIDEDKIDEAALALFYLTLHDKFGRAWKQIDWSITDRLYEKGYIHDPVGKSKSVVLTEEGLAKSEELFKKLFVKSE